MYSVFMLIENVLTEKCWPLPKGFNSLDLQKLINLMLMVSFK